MKDKNKKYDSEKIIEEVYKYEENKKKNLNPLRERRDYGKSNDAK